MRAATAFLKTRLFAEWLLLLVAMLALLVAAQQRGWTERFDLVLLDLEGQLNAPALDQSVILLQIDDRSLSEVGAWPWDRQTHAALIEQISAYGPRAIAYDVLFVEPTDPSSDAALADALTASGNVVLPHSFADRLNAQSGEVPIFPLPVLAAEAAASGHVALFPDIDGVARRFELVRRNGAGDFPHFTVKTLEVADHGALNSGAAPRTAIVRYGAADTFVEHSASEALAGRIPAQFFDDAIVFVGSTSPGLGDRYSVPAYAGSILSGVEMQVHLASAMLTDNLITPASAGLTLAIQVGVIVLLFASFWRLSPSYALAMALALITGLLAASLGSLIVFNVWLPVGAALLAIVISYPLWGWRRLASVSRFLETEAVKLRELANLPRGHASEGFDIVAQQVALLKRLTKGVSGNLKLIQDVISASPDAMLVTDGDDKMIMGNLGAESLFGPVDQAQGTQLSDLITSAGGVLNDGEDELSFADGRTFWLASAELEPDVGSRVMSLREITALKEAERQRRETLEFLSHDMRSPQAAIISLAGELDASEGNNNEMGTDMGDRLRRIKDQAGRTLKLTDDFVQIARIESEGVDREETELNSVLQEAADRAFPLARKKQIEVVCDLSEEPIFAVLDPFAMARMLDNLISNAVKFSASGGRVELDLELAGESHFVLHIRDNGPGLPPQRVDHPFARFGARNADEGPSSGLGLAYVKQVVDRHGGTIAIETAPDKGTHFAITLPYA